jgi:hypothetical protein
MMQSVLTRAKARDHEGAWCDAEEMVLKAAA